MKVEGLDNILRNLGQLDPKTWKREAMKKMRDDQKAARSDMRANAPKASGKLKRSIRTQAWMRKQQKGAEVGIFVRTGPVLKGKGRVWYAHFSEVGTDKQPALHYIKNAQDKYGNDVVEGMKDVVYDVIKKANGK